MGYFSNGTENDMYVAEWCSHCIHGQDEQKPCHVMDLHWIWNYDQHGKDAVSQAKAEGLTILIPRDKEGFNEECTMFVRNEARNAKG
jgi:hypothetical protein